jgi:hypothetical protein
MLPPQRLKPMPAARLRDRRFIFDKLITSAARRLAVQRLPSSGCCSSAI